MNFLLLQLIIILSFVGAINTSNNRRLLDRRLLDKTHRIKVNLTCLSFSCQTAELMIALEVDLKYEIDDELKEIRLDRVGESCIFHETPQSVWTSVYINNCGQNLSGTLIAGEFMIFFDYDSEVSSYLLYASQDPNATLKPNRAKGLSVNRSYLYTLGLHITYDYSILVKYRQQYKTRREAIYTMLHHGDLLISAVNDLFHSLNMTLIIVHRQIFNFKVRIPKSLIRAYFRSIRHLSPWKYSRNILFVEITLRNSSSHPIEASVCSEDDFYFVYQLESEPISMSEATRFSHSIGITLGLKGFKKSRCNCPEKGCIMDPESMYDAQGWGRCTLKRIRKAAKIGLISCLKEEILLYTRTVCGDGMLQGSETCDCGKDHCGPSCVACQLVSGLACATGACCNQDSGMLFDRNSVICRHAVSECDIAEYCDGESEFCVKDKWKPNGTPCSHGFCSNGHCIGVDEICQIIWGPRSFYNPDCMAMNESCNWLYCSTNSSSYVPWLGKGWSTNGTKQCRYIKPLFGFSARVGYPPDGLVCGQQKICRKQHCRQPANNVLIAKNVRKGGKLKQRHKKLGRLEKSNQTSKQLINLGNDSNQGLTKVEETSTIAAKSTTEKIEIQLTGLKLEKELTKNHTEIENNYQEQISAANNEHSTTKLPQNPEESLINMINGTQNQNKSSVPAKSNLLNAWISHDVIVFFGLGVALFFLILIVVISIYCHCRRNKAAHDRESDPPTPPAIESIWCTPDNIHRYFETQLSNSPSIDSVISFPSQRSLTTFGPRRTNAQTHSIRSSSSHRSSTKRNSRKTKQSSQPETPDLVPLPPSFYHHC